MNKTNLRAEMNAKRNSLDDEEIINASERVLKNLFVQNELVSSSCIGLYMATQGEIDVGGTISFAKRLGKEIGLPRIVENKIKFYRFEGFDQLKKGRFGILEPIGGRECKPELLVVPGVAFDLNKHRLGFGKGYYDEYLSKHRVFSIGVCYEWQLLDNVPKEKHDMQMDKIIAEDWVIE